MADQQFELSFDVSKSVEPAVAGDLRGEIAGVWGLPLGESVEVWFRDGELERISGVLELHVAPDYPWNPRQTLQLRIAGYIFSSRQIEHWTRM